MLSCSITEVLFFILGLIAGTETPLLAIQLLWLNVITDGFQDLALSLEKPEEGIMEEKPRPTNESLFSRSMIIQSGLMGTVMGLIVFGSWMMLRNTFNLDLVTSRSLVMALMVFLQNIHAFNCKSELQSAFKFRMFENWFFFVAVVGSIGLQIILMEVPTLSMFLELTTVSYKTLAVLLLVSMSILVVSEVFKAIKRKMLRSGKLVR